MNNCPHRVDGVCAECIDRHDAVERERRAASHAAPDIGADAEALIADVMLAIGALAASRNPMLQGIARRLHVGRPLLAALVALGHAHPDRLALLMKGGAR